MSSVIVVAADGGDRAPLGLAGIEVRRGEDDLVADRQPVASSTWIEVAPALAVADSLVQVLVRSPCRFSVPPEIMMPRSPMPAMMSSPLHVVGEGDGGLAGVGLGFGADRQLAVQHDPLGGQLQVGVVREGELAVDGQAAQRRRADVEDHFLVLGDRDLVACGRHLVVRPGGGIGPVRRRRSACATANTPPSRNAGTSDTRRNERFFLLMTSTPQTRR